VSQGIKAGWVAFAIIVVLTASKFALYAISGSMAVLSEAWHSFSDIATTLLVLVSIYRQERKSRRQAEGDAGRLGADSTALAARANLLKRLYRWVRAINTELKISVVIGLVLLFAALSILWRAATAEPVAVKLPLTTGLIFIGLSFGSFFLYRFEQGIGAAIKSAALTADSHHSRADTAITLLTGISLVAYHFGANIDRWTGLAIAGYILVFSTELLVNSCRAILRGDREVAFQYRFVSIVWRLFQARTYGRWFDWADRHCPLERRFRAVLGFLPVLWRWTLRLALVCLLAAYCSTMLYTVGPGETALVLRFGAVTGAPQGVGPGLHLKLPFPVDRVLRFPTQTVQSLTVGNASTGGVAMIWSKEHGDNSTFISGDNSLFLPFIVIHYRIRDARQYYLALRDGVPEKVLAASSYRILNRIFATTPFYELMITRRKEWTARCKEQMQQENDAMRTGLEIVEFCLKDLHPPTDLARSYEDVIAAVQLREKYLNDAGRHVHSLLSQERIAALRTQAEAQGYVVEKQRVAEGEASNYLLRFQGYQGGGEVIKDLLFLKTAEETLQGKKLYLVDPDSGIDDRLIYMENYLMRGKRP